MRITCFALEIECRLLTAAHNWQDKHGKHRQECKLTSEDVTCPSTVSWKHLPTCPFCRWCGLTWPWLFPLVCGCRLLCSVDDSCALPGWERCWTECAPSVVASLWPGWTRATWWILTVASGGCCMWTFTRDGWWNTAAGQRREFRQEAWEFHRLTSRTNDVKGSNFSHETNAHY